MAKLLEINLADVFVAPKLREETVEVVELPDGSKKTVFGRDWYDPGTGAQIYFTLFDSCHRDCGGNERLIKKAARELNEVFGIPVDQAIRRIQQGG